MLFIPHFDLIFACLLQVYISQNGQELTGRAAYLQYRKVGFSVYCSQCMSVNRYFVVFKICTFVSHL